MLIRLVNVVFYSGSVLSVLCIIFFLSLMPFSGFDPAILGLIMAPIFFIPAWCFRYIVTGKKEPFPQIVAFIKGKRNGSKETKKYPKK